MHTSIDVRMKFNVSSEAITFAFLNIDRIKSASRNRNLVLILGVISS